MLLRGIDPFLCDASVSVIAWYQVVVSPRKGFACAYRVRTGGESCSQFARHVFETGGWWSGLRAVIHRFGLCAEAARALRQQQGVARANRVYDEYFDGGSSEQKTQGTEDETGYQPACRFAGHLAADCCLPICASSVCGP
jgi:putative component of membrane protein insertase Oxa1/YidC/SpoIIIJ protein YidD